MGDLGSIPGLGRSPGEGKGYPLQGSGLENSMDCIVHGAHTTEQLLLLLSKQNMNFFQLVQQLKKKKIIDAQG